MTLGLQISCFHRIAPPKFYSLLNRMSSVTELLIFGPVVYVNLLSLDSLASLQQLLSREVYILLTCHIMLPVLLAKPLCTRKIA